MSKKKAIPAEKLPFVAAGIAILSRRMSLAAPEMPFPAAGTAFAGQKKYKLGSKLPFPPQKIQKSLRKCTILPQERQKLELNRKNVSPSRYSRQRKWNLGRVKEHNDPAAAAAAM